MKMLCLQELYSMLTGIEEENQMNAIKTNILRLSLLLAAMAILMAGCAMSKQGTSRYSREAGADMATVADDARRDASSEAGKSSSAPAAAEPKAASADTKIIKTAHLEFQVDDLEKSKKQIGQFVDAEKGYISNLEEMKEPTRIHASYAIRVPAAGFDRLVENIRKEGKYINNSKIERKDVTEEFVDIKARMETEKLEEARYREILHQAKSIKEILEVETYLGATREKIEAKEGKLKYLVSQAEYSTIFAQVYQTIPYERPPKGESEGFFSRLWSSLRDGWTGLVEFFLALITIWPVLIIIVVIVYFIIRKNKRNKQSAGKKVPPPLPESKK
jgi:hypothetical protein